MEDVKTQGMRHLIGRSNNGGVCAHEEPMQDHGKTNVHWNSFFSVTVLINWSFAYFRFALILQVQRSFS